MLWLCPVLQRREGVKPIRSTESPPRTKGPPAEPCCPTHRRMKFTACLASLLAFAVVPALGAALTGITVAYDTAYDDGSASLDTVACSNGANGLETLGYTTLGSLPNFPNIGAAYAVAGWNSPACGTCWQLTYTNARGVSTSLNITAVDHAGANSFNIALNAMNKLTNNQAVALGRVPVTATQVPSSGCGL